MRLRTDPFECSFGPPLRGSPKQRFDYWWRPGRTLPTRAWRVSKQMTDDSGNPLTRSQTCGQVVGSALHPAVLEHAVFEFPLVSKRPCAVYGDQISPRAGCNRRSFFVQNANMVAEYAFNLRISLRMGNPARIWPRSTSTGANSSDSGSGSFADYSFFDSWQHARWQESVTLRISVAWCAMSTRRKRCY